MEKTFRLWTVRKTAILMQSRCKICITNANYRLHVSNYTTECLLVMTLSSLNLTIHLNNLQMSKFHLFWFIVFNSTSPSIIIIATFSDYKLNSPHGFRKFTAFFYQRGLPTHNVSHRHPLNPVEFKYFVM